MWVELKNVKTGLGENVNIPQVARCMKATNDTIKIMFPGGSLVQYDLPYKD